MHARSRLALVATVVLIASLVARPSRIATARAEGPSLLAGNRTLAPRVRVRSLEGKTLDVEALRAQGPVLLDFWATWCKPCVASLPELQALHERYAARGLTVIGVSVDGPRNFAKVRPFAARAGLTYPIVLDEDGALQEGFRVLAVPTSVLIARDGTIVRVQQGFRPGEAAALALAIEAALPPVARADSAARARASGDSSAAMPAPVDSAAANPEPR